MLNFAFLFFQVDLGLPHDASWVFAPPSTSTAHRGVAGEVRSRFTQFRTAKAALRSGFDWLLRRPGGALEPLQGAPSAPAGQDIRFARLPGSFHSPGLGPDELVAARNRLRSHSTPGLSRLPPPVPPRAPGTCLVAGSQSVGASGAQPSKPMSMTSAGTISGVVGGETQLGPESIAALAEHLARKGLLIAPSSGGMAADAARLDQLERGILTF